jgi:hypothetical protein
MRAIDELLPAIRSAFPGVQVEQLQTSFPTDDAGLWFITHPDADVEVQVESHNGEFPFLIESSENDARVTTTDIDETIAALRWTLGRYAAPAPHPGPLP